MTEPVGRQVGRRAYGNLDADVLSQVVAYLSQKDAVEAMFVTKHWEKTIKETSSLWKRSGVSSKGVLKGTEEGADGMVAQNDFLFEVLRVAEEVTFSRTHSWENVVAMSVEGLLGSNLRILELHSERIYPSFSQNLASSFPQLHTLVVSRGPGPIAISHPTLEALVTGCDGQLRVDCPSLTRLSTYGNEYFREGSVPETFRTPSLHCPKLISLRLAPSDCTEGVLESIAAQAPGIKLLEAFCTKESPFDEFMHFHSLEILSVHGCGKVPSDAFDHCPLLTSLSLLAYDRDEIEYQFAGDLTVMHTGLRKLSVRDEYGKVELTCDCPLLEEVSIVGAFLGEECFESINSFCPQLKRVHLEENEDGGMQDDFEREPMNLVHDSVEEAELMTLWDEVQNIDCPKMTKLVTGWGWRGMRKTTSRPVIKCPNLTSLVVHAHSHIIPVVPSMLAAMPKLEVFKLFGDNELVTNLVLEHSCIRKLVIGKIKMVKLTLVMPRVEHLNISKSIVRVLQVAYTKTVTGKYKRVSREPRTGRNVVPSDEDTVLVELLERDLRTKQKELTLGEGTVTIELLE